MVQSSELPAKTNKKPSFLVKIGAMLGLMQESKFSDKEEEEDGRMASASTFKSRQSQAAKELNMRLNVDSHQSDPAKY